MKKISLFTILVLSGTLWIFAGYRVLALQTGKLGPVRVNITHVDVLHRFISWSAQIPPQSFDRHRLRLEPNSETTFILRVPARFTSARIFIQSTGPVNIYAEYKNPATKPSDLSSERTIRFTELNRFPGGYRLHLVNQSNQPIAVTGIKLTYIP